MVIERELMANSIWSTNKILSDMFRKQYLSKQEYENISHRLRLYVGEFREDNIPNA